MKLHNLLLTAALFLTAGIASAAVYHDGDDDVYYSLDGYVYQETDEENRHYKLENVILTTSENFPYKVYLEREGAGAHTTTYFWSQELTPGSTQTINLPADNHLDYKVVLSVNGKISSYLYHYNYTDVGTGVFTQSGNSIVFNDGKGNIATVTFGSPLPTPVITLLIALGFGAAFVMYRNRKQVKA